MTIISSSECEIYHVGGSLPLNSPVYVHRESDDKLYMGLKAGEFCYVLNSRQMGKSSLRVQTMQRLRSEGFSCVAIDLTQIGSKNTTSDQWYAGIALNLAKGLYLNDKPDKFDLRSWLKTRDHLSPVQRLSEFIEEVLLNQISHQIVVFVDEIDSVLSLDFSLDDFFALIRECYNRRADRSDYKRITFALLGVATPSELIQDKKRTPFNIGRAIELHGFKLSEIKPLTIGLNEKLGDPESILERVLYWTNGQPFLTQKVCRLIASTSSYDPADTKLKWVDKLVLSEIIKNWEAQDNPEHIKTIQDRLLSNKDQVKNLLGLYKRILTSRRKVMANDSSTQEELCLSGLVVKEKGCLVIQNRIYGKVFDRKWVEKELENLSLYDRLQVDWFASNSKDASKLLTGAELLNAINKTNLRPTASPQDWQYLVACLQHELQSYQSSLLEREQVSKTLEKSLAFQKKASVSVQNELKKEKEKFETTVRLVSDHLAITNFFIYVFIALVLLLAFQSLLHLQITAWELIIIAISMLLLIGSSLLSPLDSTQSLSERVEERKMQLKRQKILDKNTKLVETNEK